MNKIRKKARVLICNYCFIEKIPSPLVIEQLSRERDLSPWPVPTTSSCYCPWCTVLTEPFFTGKQENSARDHTKSIKLKFIKIIISQNIFLSLAKNPMLMTLTKLAVVLDLIYEWTLKQFYNGKQGQKCTFSSFYNCFTHVIDVQPAFSAKLEKNWGC